MSDSTYSRPPPEYATASSSTAKKPTAPQYGATEGGNNDDARKPLLQPGEGLGTRDAWNESGDVEDDFNVRSHFSGDAVPKAGLELILC